MKTMFSMGFFAADSFRPHRLGQITIDNNGYLASLNDAFSKLEAVNSWMRSRSDWQQLLGANLDNFQSLESSAHLDAPAAQNLQSVLINADPATTQFAVSPGDKATADNFIAEVRSIYAMMQAAASGSPAPISTAAPSSSDSGITGLIKSFFGPKKTTPVVPGAPLPASASPAIPTPVLIGGGLVALGLIILAARS